MKKYLHKIIGSDLESDAWKITSDDFFKMDRHLSMLKEVTIIIPVYNGKEALIRLFQSLTRTDELANIIIINDCSTEPGIDELCHSFSQQQKAITVIKNRVNLGFVKSVNIGIINAPKDHDIVLLNSDTEVTLNWLTKLKTAAYSFNNVATVCPLSNSAGIFSVPYKKKQNNLEKNYTSEIYNQVLELIAPLPHEVVPATSGFCLYIRRSALNKLGYLDNFLFRHGYGEDNDFSISVSK